MKKPLAYHNTKNGTIMIRNDVFVAIIAMMILALLSGGIFLTALLLVAS